MWVLYWFVVYEKQTLLRFSRRWCFSDQNLSKSSISELKLRVNFSWPCSSYRLPPSMNNRRLTGLADPYLLQVWLLDVMEVINAGNVEAISDAYVELLQLDLSQELVQPLSVLVHQHDPVHEPAGMKRFEKRWKDIFRTVLCAFFYSINLITTKTEHSNHIWGEFGSLKVGFYGKGMNDYYPTCFR